jgi:hypothetical protein
MLAGISLLFSPFFFGFRFRLRCRYRASFLVLVLVLVLVLIFFFFCFCCSTFDFFGWFYFSLSLLLSLLFRRFVKTRLLLLSFGLSLQFHLPPPSFIPLTPPSFTFFFLHPLLTPSTGAAFSTIGITGTTGFLAGAGGAAVITTGGVLTGSSIAVRGMINRTKQVSLASIRFFCFFLPFFVFFRDLWFRRWTRGLRGCKRDHWMHREIIGCRERSLDAEWMQNGSRELMT